MCAVNGSCFSKQTFSPFLNRFHFYHLPWIHFRGSGQNCLFTYGISGDTHIRPKISAVVPDQTENENNKSCAHSSTQLGSSSSLQLTMSSSSIAFPSQGKGLLSYRGHLCSGFMMIDTMFVVHLAVGKKCVAMDSMSACDR